MGGEQVKDDADLDGQDNQLPYQCDGMEIRECAEEAKKPKAQTQRQENNLEDASPVGELPKADSQEQMQADPNNEHDTQNRSQTSGERLPAGWSPSGR